MSTPTPHLPAAIYVWIVPSEEVLDQPGSWRIRKWDTEPFPEANFALSSPSETRRVSTPAQVTQMIEEHQASSHSAGNDTMRQYASLAERRRAEAFQKSGATNVISERWRTDLIYNLRRLAKATPYQAAPTLIDTAIEAANYLEEHPVTTTGLLPPP